LVVVAEMMLTPLAQQKIAMVGLVQEALKI
jgi:hypothetical protein